eukprot:ANDGO_04178.mRNA.1 putative glutamine--tRNA ligase
MTADEYASLFERIGVEATNAKAMSKNTKLASYLADLISSVNLSSGCDKAIGAQLVTLATRVSVNSRSHGPFVAKYIAEQKLRTNAQVDAAVNYINRIGDEVAQIDAAAFENECGVGVSFTAEQLTAKLDDVFAKLAVRLKEERYRVPLGDILQPFREGQWKWADFGSLRTMAQTKLESVLGPKTEDDLKPVPKADKKVVKKEEEKKKVEETKAVEEEKVESMRELIGRELNTSRNTQDLVAKHIAETGDAQAIVTRFPPEPNGYLHIGHAKAMNFSFGYAAEAGSHGKCFLRFDDTNPEAERDEYIQSIEEDVRWMGFTPCAVTASSDYFGKLLDIARDLIRRDLAYVDHQTPAEMKESREKRTPSPYRNRPIEESVREFERMVEGQYEEGQATLRLKMDYANDNPNMRDLVAYRIKFHPHPKTGNKYCVYPSYDYTHCLCDSFENITHSLCTLEFEVRREPYFWILDAVHTWKPSVWEYSRLNITRNVLSKRKLIALVNNKVVHGWDDPRLLTIRGLRRRGYTPEILKDLCNRVGVTRAENVTSYEVLEHCARIFHDQHAVRRLGVLEPVKVTITNWDERPEAFRNPGDTADVVYLEAPNHPKDTAKGVRKIELRKEIFIESSDFRTVDSSDYYGLAPNKEVGLRYAGINLKCTRVVSDKELECTAVWADRKKVKGHIHWVAAASSVPAEVRLYEPLFNDDNGEQINANSERIVLNAALETSVADMPVGASMQLERVGFFVVDKDTVKGEKIVLVRVVTLKESYSKDAGK